MNILKKLWPQSWSLYEYLILFLSLFHLTVNLIWINLNKLPFPWDQAGHTIIAYKFTDYFSGKGGLSFLNISDYYPPFTHILVAILMLIFGREPNIGPIVITGFFISSIAFLYLYAKEILGSKLIGFVAALFYSFLPFVDNLSRYFLLEIPLVAVTLATLYFLEKTENFSSKKYVYLFAISAGVALLIKWAALVYLLVPVAVKFFKIYQLRENLNLRFKNILTAGIIIFLMSFLWYVSNLDVLINSSRITATAEESDPQSIFSLDNFIHYFHHMMNFQLIWPGMLVFLFSLPAFLYSLKRKSLSLILTIFTIYICFSLIGNKDLRYIIILAPLSSIIVAWGLVKFLNFEKLLGAVTAFAIIFFYLIYFFSLGFGFPLDPIRDNIRKTVFLPVIGGIDLVNLASDSSFLLAPKYSPTVWPNLVISEEMSKHNPSQKIKILIIAEKPFFNQVNMELARRQQNKDKIEFHAPYTLTPLKDDASKEEYLNNFSVVLVAGKDLGPQGGIRHIVVMKQLKEFLESEKSQYATKINTYPLPDGDFLTVYKIEQWPRQIIVEEMSKHDPKNNIKILVISSKKQLNGNNLETARKELNKERIQFFSADEFSGNYTDYDLVLVNEGDIISLENIKSKGERINTYYLPDSDKLAVFKINK